MTRMGAFTPTADGERLIQVLTGASRAWARLARWTRDRRRSGTARLDETAIAESTAYADASEAEVHLESLALELRSADGAVVPTDIISVTDTAFTIELWRDDDYVPPDPVRADTEDERRLIEAIERDTAVLDEPEVDATGMDDGTGEESALPAYQIHVHLASNGGTAMPRG